MAPVDPGAAYTFQLVNTAIDCREAPERELFRPVAWASGPVAGLSLRFQYFNRHALRNLAKNLVGCFGVVGEFKVNYDCYLAEFEIPVSTRLDPIYLLYIPRVSSKHYRCSPMSIKISH